MLKPCLRCGRPSPGSRCTACERIHDKARRPSFEARYGADWLRIRRVVLRRQPYCAVCGTPGDFDNPLTVDHIVPLEKGGTNDIDNLQVLCRRDNSAKGAR